MVRVNYTAYNCYLIYITLTAGCLQIWQNEIARVLQTLFNSYFQTIIKRKPDVT